MFCLCEFCLSIFTILEMKAENFEKHNVKIIINFSMKDYSIYCIDLCKENTTECLGHEKAQ